MTVVTEKPSPRTSIRAAALGCLVLILTSFLGLASFFIDPVTVVGIYVIGSALFGMLMPRVWYLAILSCWPSLLGIYDMFVNGYRPDASSLELGLNLLIPILTASAAYVASKLRQSPSRAAYWVLLMALAPYLAWSAHQAFIIFRQDRLLPLRTRGVQMEVVLLDGTALRGYVTEVTESGVVLTDAKGGAARRIDDSEVSISHAVYSVDTFSIGSRVAIWLIVGITAAVFLLALMKALLVLGRVDRTPMH